MVATHEGTGVAREGVTDANGEFVFSALPSGPYTVKVELTGFKTLQQQGMQLGAGQSVRQTFALEVGTLSETVTVAGEAPLVDNAASVQADSIGAQEVTELPTNRRNLSGLMGLSTGVNTYGEGGGFVQMNGVAAGGTGVTVDGTEANSNPEARSLAQYGGQNQISVMSLDSVAEVQIVKGVLPAEYGGVAGGQINVISRSGTNVFHGSGFYAGQNESWNARQFFSTAQQPVGTFNQYGGTLGGPVLKNRAFFFTTYEGYREEVELNLDVVVPYQAVRDEIMRALPYPETKTVLDALPMPTENVITSGVVNSQVGRWRGLGIRRRTENHIVAKGDISMFNGANLGLTYTRLRPFTLEPRPNPNNINDREFPNEQDRVAAQLVMTRGAWVSESRFGWNKTYLARLDAFLGVMGPNQPAEVMPYGRRMPAFAITGLFATPRSEIWDMKGITYSFEQKFSRAYQRHLVKTGFRYLREKGGRLNPENPSFTYQNYGELLANIPTSLSTSYGAPPHDSNMDSYSFFVQDDWRLGSRFVLNAGLRYDYHGHVKVYPTTDVPVEIVNYEKFTDINKLDFGPLRDPMEPYNSDGNNFGPRVGFAWTVTGDETTVVRGGVGYLHSPHLIATVRQGAANPYVPFRIVYNRTESIAKRRDVADVHGRCAGDRARRCGGTQIGLLDFRSGHSDAVYDSVDAQRAARVCRHDVGRGGLHPHRREELPAAAAIHTGVRQADGRAAESLARRAGRLLRRQQPDDGIQRLADVAAQAFFKSLLVGRQLHAGQDDCDAGRRSLSLLHRDQRDWRGEFRRQPGLLQSGIRPRAGQQRRAAQAQRRVHLRAAPVWG